MGESGFIISGIISLAFIISSISVMLKRRKSKRNQNTMLTSLNILVIGVFFAVFVCFIPVYIDSYGESDPTVISLILALNNTMRVFILDSDFDIVREAVADIGSATQTFFKSYFSVLYVLSPVLTASFVLSMLKNVNAEIKYFFSKGSGLFVFSHLNDRSAAIAESIYNDPEIENPVIVFAGVTEKVYEEESECVSAVKKTNAILLEKNITDVNIENKKGRLEMFYVGEDEAENVSDATAFITSDYKHKKITVCENGEKPKKVLKKYNQRENTKVFVFARSEGNARIIDSLDKGNQLEYADEKYFENNSFIDDSKLFKVRRVDDVQMLAWDSVEKADIFSHYREVNGEKLISVLLAGLGEYGCELLKTLVWYGQIKGYRLEINVVHNGKDGKAVIGHLCPDIISTNDQKVEGDSFYSIRFYDDINVFTSSWDDLLFYKGDDAVKAEAAKRLADTTIAFVALGDDDKNIQASVELRAMFDRINNVVATYDQSYDELPVIYSIVYNEQKAANISGSCADAGNIQPLITHKYQPYNIRFIGSHSSQYKYDSIYRESLEKEAFNTCHMSWSYYSVDRDIEQIEKDENRTVSAQERQNLRAKARKEQIRLYESFEYFRYSSMTKAMHRKLINSKFSDMFICENSSYECDCEKCWARRANEHNRWNAYIRSYGYVKGERKADRAKVHGDLIPFDELSEATQRLD